MIELQVCRAIAAEWALPLRRGKSALRRARCRVTPGTAGRQCRPGCRTGPQKQTARAAVLVMVKRWCKRPPAQAAMPAARQPPPGARPSRVEVLPVPFETRVGCTRRVERRVPDRWSPAGLRTCHRMRLTGRPGGSANERVSEWFVDSLICIMPFQPCP